VAGVALVVRLVVLVLAVERRVTKQAVVAHDAAAASSAAIFST
jgi:hypothetical protein